MAHMTDFDAHRRRYLALLALLPLLAGATPVAARPEPPAAAAGRRFRERIQAIERRAGGRLGVSAMSLGATALSYRGDERYLMCSTFKLALAACVLSRVDSGKERLDRPIAIAPEAVVSYSPITGKHVGGSLSVAELCAAAVTVSDNTAANLLLRTLGGPPGLTAFLRSAGDATSRLDRFETELNFPAPGHDWDSTTPEAMARLVGQLLFGTVLSTPSREQLRAWTTQASTGMERVRAALPAAWPQGDKTGTGPTHTNDVAWFTPPGQAPWVVSVYYADGKGDADAQSAVIAEVARVLLELLPGQLSSS